MTKQNIEVTEMIGNAVIEYARTHPEQFWSINRYGDTTIIQDAAGDEWVFDIELASEAIEKFDRERGAQIQYIVGPGIGSSQSPDEEPDGPDGYGDDGWSYSLYRVTGEGRC